MKSPVRLLSSHVFTFQADITKHPLQPYFNFLKNEINITSGMLYYLENLSAVDFFPLLVYSLSPVSV